MVNIQENDSNKFSSELVFFDRERSFKLPGGFFEAFGRAHHACILVHSQMCSMMVLANGSDEPREYDRYHLSDLVEKFISKFEIKDEELARDLGLFVKHRNNITHPFVNEITGSLHRYADDAGKGLVLIDTPYLEMVSDKVYSIFDRIHSIKMEAGDLIHGEEGYYSIDHFGRPVRKQGKPGASSA